MNLEEIKKIVANGEDSQHQFKENIRNVDSLAAEIDLIHADEISTRASTNILNVPLFSEFFQKVYKEDPPETSAERTQLLENMNLANGNRLNLAGLLLFGNKPQIYKPEFILKAVSVAGAKVTDSYLDSEDFD